jgi:hypothetical protein
VLLARLARICQVWAFCIPSHSSTLFNPTFPPKNDNFHWITAGPTGNCPKSDPVSVTSLLALKPRISSVLLP